MGARVSLKRDGDNVLLQLVSPPRNQTDQLFFDELSRAVEVIDSENRCSGVVVCSEGNHFSSGADIDELVSTFADPACMVPEARRRSVEVYTRLSRLRVPVVAAVKGCCLGSGLELALACHFRVATKTALFSFPETGFGLLPGCGGTYRLPRLVGMAAGLEMILSGRSILADDALRINLVDTVVARSELIPAACRIINLISGGRT